ncbi:Septum formation initiator [Clostridium acidisoli DSM 12555]|jgi:cell division protein FtsB|uniref:Septum formation initiator n=1 Tax=Clostridium acidisoli DSM 12555 TaxID=1121291 RepID=A0A1W1XWV9_9CLOT|nr:septum formation initiator family protein [Clostridium acidisoli]SMC28324.1 Septum formation initiator [Clostridium acidisoli DSM 12555]
MKKGFKLKFLIIGVFMVNICYILVNQQITMNKIREETNNKTSQISKLKSDNQKLQDEIKMARSDQYSEKLAREKLGLIKQGEIPVINTK